MYDGISIEKAIQSNILLDQNERLTGKTKI